MPVATLIALICKILHHPLAKPYLDGLTPSMCDVSTPKPEMVTSIGDNPEPNVPTRATIR
jgi:hypothetical protein